MIQSTPVRDWVEENAFLLGIAVIVATGLGVAAVVPFPTDVAIQSATYDSDGAFDRVEMTGTRGIAVYLASPAESTGPAEIYVVGPEGEVRDRSEILPRQSKQVLAVGDEDASLKPAQGEFEIVALDGGGDVMSRATVTIGPPEGMVSL